MKNPVKILTASLLCLTMVVACAGVQYAETRTREVNVQLQEDIKLAWTLFRTGQVTEEERDELIEQAQQIATKELKEIPEEAKAIEEAEGDLKGRGKSFLANLMDIAMWVILGGGGLGVGVMGVRKIAATPPVKEDAPSAK